MSVTTSQSRIAYTGDGATVVFPFPYLFQNNADIEVWVNNIQVTSGFTTTGASNAALPAVGGQVEFTLPPTIGASVVLFRNPTTLQKTVLAPNDPLPVKTFETMVDAAMLAIQRVNDILALQPAQNQLPVALSYPFQESALPGTLPPAATRANSILAFDANGLPTTASIPPSIGAGNLTNEGPFLAGVHFAPGVTTTLTLSQAYGTNANVRVQFDDSLQGFDQYSLVGDELTFTSAIPEGIEKVYVVGGTTLSVFVPGLGSVGPEQLTSGAVGDGQINWAGAALIKTVSSLTALRALGSSTYSTAFLDTPTQSGTYAFQASDTTSSDNGVTVIVGLDGGRWHLADGGMLTATRAGANGNGTTDDTAALALAETLGEQIYLHDGVFPSTAKRQSYRYVGPGSIKVNGVVQPTAKLGAVIVGGNFLPNCQWQLWGDVVGGSIPIQKQNQAGTGNQSTINCTGFTPTTASPVFLTNNTGQLKVGDLVQISGGGFQWGYAGVGYINTATAVRVIAVTPNVSFQVAGPLGGAGVSPTSSAAVLAAPICAGDLGAVGLGPDGWSKTTSLIIWADDFAANQCPGSIRTLGLRKGSAGSEVFSWQCPAGQLSKYLGRTVTFGMLLRQSVQGGAGTSSISINDNVTGSTSSIPGTGVGFSDSVYGGFEFISVSAKIAPNATSFQVNINLTGAQGDVYYASVPTAVFGYNLGRENLGQNPGEHIHSKAHWNPPLLTPLQLTMPSAAFPGAGALYGFTGCDLQALSFDSVDKSVSRVACKVELNTPTPGASLFVANNIPAGLIFGPQPVTQVANVMNLGQAILPLYDGGKFTFFTGQSGLVVTNATFDFDDVYA